MEFSLEDLAKGVKITYEPVREVRLPAKVAMEGWLAPGLASVSILTTFSGKKIGIFSAEKGLIVEPRFGKAEITPSGLILLSGKGSMLLTGDGTVLSGADCDEVKDLGGGFYAEKKQKHWTIFRVKDRSAVTKPEYLTVSNFSEGSFAVTTKAGAQLIGEDGMPLFNEVWNEAFPFHEGFARVVAGKETRYINREGKVIFSAAGQSFRDFFNGYAVFSDKKGKYGAINSDGVVVVKPEYSFVKDCMSDMFVVSNDGVFVYGKGFQGRNFGLVAADGRSVLPRTYDKIDGLPNGSYIYGHHIVWQANMAGNTVQYASLVYGLVSPEGKVLFPDKYVGIGDESEGLIAYKTVERPVNDKWSNTESLVRFGYMKPDGTSVFEVAKVDYAESRDQTRSLMTESINHQLRPFRDGKAKVCIRNQDQHFKMPLSQEKFWTEARKTPWYEVDTSGKPVGGQADLKSSFRSLPASPFIAAFLKDADRFPQLWETNILSFDDMLEVNLSFNSYAILNSRLETVCCSYVDMPFQPAFLPNVVNPDGACSFLTKISENVWLAETDKGASVVCSEFVSPTRFSDGLAPNCTLSAKKKPIWGYMDSHGNQVVPPRFSTARPFRNGYAFAVDEKGGVILCRKAVIE